MIRKALTKQQLTLGQLIAKLEAITTHNKFGHEKPVHYDFENLCPTTLDSWRGSYDELALGYDDASQREPTITELLAELRNGIGGIYCGWKGGEYHMTEDTPVWVANQGIDGNTAIVDVLDTGFEAVLITEYCEY